MLTIALFIIDKRWTQLRGPSTDEEINKMGWDTGNGIVFGSKKNRVSTHDPTRTDLGNITQSERSQTQR